MSTAQPDNLAMLAVRVERKLELLREHSHELEQIHKRAKANSARLEF